MRPPRMEKSKTNTLITPDSEEYYIVLIVTLRAFAFNSLSRGATIVSNHLFMGGEVLDWIQGSCHTMRYICSTRQALSLIVVCN